VDELALRYRIALGNPADLALADCMHRRITLDGSTSALDRSEPEAGRNPLLNEPVILLDDVVQIWRRPAATAAIEFTGLLQFSDGSGIGGMSAFTKRGRGPPRDSASLRNSFAAIRSRFGDNMNSIVSPAESTAR
jgi:hypothetical protein